MFNNLPFFFLVSLLILGPCITFKLHQISPNPKSLNNNYFDNAYIIHRNNSLDLILFDRMVRLLNVPDVMQATDYTCGPSSLSAVLNYYQIKSRQSDLAKLAKTDPQHGTSPGNLLAAIKALNITANLKEGMNISQLENNAIAGRPTIVQIQAWADQGTDYRADYDDGHYVVFIGSDPTYLYFEDPWIIGSIGYIAKRDFMDRWHDSVFTQQRNVYNLGIIIQQPTKITRPIVKLQ